MNIEMRSIDSVKPYWKNPRHNEQTISALVELIPMIGFNQPIVVDKNGVIVKGHARYAAAIRLGMTELPVLVSENDDKTNRFDRIADNKVFELTKWIETRELERVSEPDALPEIKPERREWLDNNHFELTCPYCGEVVEVYL